MKKTLIVLAACLSIMLMAGSALAIGTGSANPYGYYGYYGNPYGYCGAGGCGTPMHHPLPYKSVQCQRWHPTGYCVQWYPERWVPVQVMIPGRWEYRPVWVPAREVTLYQYLPGYWHRTNLYGTPDVHVMRTPNGWYAMPYPGQIGDGYFNAQGVWQPAERTK
jgi:hypothetical protein